MKIKEEMKEEEKEKKWFLPIEKNKNKKVKYLIILNTPIRINEDKKDQNDNLFKLIWNLTKVKICADGGANQLYQFNKLFNYLFEEEGNQLNEENKKDQIEDTDHDIDNYEDEANKEEDEEKEISVAQEEEEISDKLLLPNYIKGDLDSIKDETKRYFLKKKKTKIIFNSNQDSTDLQKCLNLIEELEIKEKEKNVNNKLFDSFLVIHGGLTGRLDQTISTISTLLKIKEDGNNSVLKLKQIWIMDTDGKSIACALEPNVIHLMYIPHKWRSDLKNPLTCGLLPLGKSPAKITTKGLKWDLVEAETSVLGLLSTSNQILPETEVIEITTSETIMWTMEIPSFEI